MNDRFILIGHPVGHSVSPQIHARAYEALGRHAEYGLVDALGPEEARSALERVRSGELRGANVTVPYKRVALEACDRLDASAREVGAANVVARAADGALVGYNTDALALADELRAALGELAQRRTLPEPEGRSALVVGTGGAALAAVVACRLSGCDRIWVSGRRFTPETPREQWPGYADWQRLDAQLLPWGEALPRDLAVIVQATSAGMKGTSGGEELAAGLAWAELSPLVAYDLVYNPPSTPFLRAAAEHGHLACGGLGMLVGQAARAIEIWWGVRPPSEPLEKVARQALGLS